MFNFDPAWNIVGAVVIAIILIVAMIWQRRSDKKRKIKPGDSVTVLGAGEYHKVTSVRGVHHEYGSLDGNEFPIYDQSALHKE